MILRKSLTLSSYIDRMEICSLQSQYFPPTLFSYPARKSKMSLRREGAIICFYGLFSVGDEERVVGERSV